MRVSEIRVKRIRVNQGLGVLQNSKFSKKFIFKSWSIIFQREKKFREIPLIFDAEK